jgi:hypothetical protein
MRAYELQVYAVCRRTSSNMSINTNDVDDNEAERKLLFAIESFRKQRSAAEAVDNRSSSAVPSDVASSTKVDTARSDNTLLSVPRVAVHAAGSTAQLEESWVCYYIYRCCYSFYCVCM